MSASLPRVRKVVIPAAGRGTRLLPATKSQPKEMLPVARKPVIQYVVEEMVDAGLGQILIVSGRTKRAIDDHFDPDPVLQAELSRRNDRELMAQFAFEHLDAHYFYVRQSEPRGLGHAVLLAEEFVAGEPFAVALGDSIVWNGGGKSLMRQLVQTHVETGAAATIAVEEVTAQDVVNYGIVKPVDKVGHVFQISDLVEKPSVEDAPSRLAIAARYIFGPQVFSALRDTAPGHGGEIQLTDAIRILLSAGCPVWCVRLEGGCRRYDIGNFDSYFKAFVEISLQDPELGESLRAHLASLLKEEA
ncbi:MAG TPA: UTP--glucose-1-phosphate uridylyltransferase [Armatimonadota bacterium]|nr:UTP--glucose-1-phosphate uridylyltransferase [Armatimonadota bacterium]HOM82052.1 UTP--glucose-1-phosphate uridylyltransferase [Armatimonadota bacterium]HOQ27678.1 UTP--glucose-1-phosphate uridylyltransferase [Armatimonadota bacterium]HPO73761.1 UTP--glucose-1-phosphate uridylyltransferase [Armatimonadota bacterium]HPT99367.1 UTP--glucose-1-phosphate uridylyltransferase [Armatimonadota bacterium]